jgi:hypothetical protein
MVQIGPGQDFMRPESTGFSGWRRWGKPDYANDAPLHRLMQVAMLRMEDRIRKLCTELLAKKSDEEIRPILVELQGALRVHIERMRERFGSYPFLVERRARNDGPQVNKQDQEDRPQEAHPRDTGT